MCSDISARRLVSVDAFSTVRVLAEFLVDPLRCMNRFLAPLGEGVEFYRVGRHRESARRFLFLYAPEYNKQVLSKFDCIKSSGLWPLPGPNGSAQEKLRKNDLKSFGADYSLFHETISPQLSRTRSVEHFDAIKKIAIEEIGAWPHGVNDIYSLGRSFLSRSAFTLLFGDQQRERTRVLADSFKNYHELNWSKLAHLFRLNFPGTHYRRALANADALHSMIEDWVQEARGMPPDSNLRAALGSMKSASGCPISENLATANTALIALASFLTISSAFTWTSLLLALHPKIAADLRDELSSQPPIEDIDYATLSALPLLDAVVNEGIRLITPVPIMGMRAFDFCEIAGRQLLPGSRIVLAPHLTHRMPDLYPAGDRFRPERWFSLKRSAYQYLPFAAGSRLCPGRWFAIVNLKVGLMTMLQRFRLQVPSGVRIDRMYAAITLPKGDVPLEFLPLDRNVDVRHCAGSIFDLFVPEPDRSMCH
jgi:cytochrome P450